MANAVSVPQHQRLAETLLGRIVEGEIPVGDKLPTEAALCAEYGLARETVRRALARIEGLGMITRSPGIGSVVVARAPVAAYQPAVRSVADLAALAAETRLLRPTTAEVSLDASAAARVGAPTGSRWFKLEGATVTRRGGGPPLCWSEHYLRADLDRGKLLRRPDPDALQGVHSQQEISATLLPDEMAAALRAAPGGAALVLPRRYRDDSGRLASVGIHTHPAERYSIITDI